MVVDEYEIMLELIKGELKGMKQPSEKKKLLQKFMIALDIHYYMRCGSVKNTVASIMDFVKTFNAYLTC